MTDEFRIKKLRKAVTITIGSQAPVPGFIFLHPTTPHHHGPERVADLLASKSPFLPFETESGEMRIIHKKEIQSIVVDANFELEILRAYGKEAIIARAVTVVLGGGRQEKGELLIEPIQGASRALDELNRSKGFFLLLCGLSVHIIGIEHVSDIREEKKT